MLLAEECFHLSEGSFLLPVEEPKVHVVPLLLRVPTHEHTLPGDQVAGHLMESAILLKHLACSLGMRVSTAHALDAMQPLCVALWTADGLLHLTVTNSVGLNRTGLGG